MIFHEKRKFIVTEPIEKDKEYMVYVVGSDKIAQDESDIKLRN